ncbi:hypothetical protein GCM10023185_44240 [Hymenobacter saemangeumensis]|uniref:DUF2007 domain-containing protein n=1 Tax=Hymenobacter saemangeumensis TaxID=1084522 RepID=A0ABP8IS65_9BACT
MSDFLRYQVFPSPALAEPLLGLLEQQGIVHKTHYTPPRFSAVLGTTSAEQFVVSLRPEDFTRARELEEQQAELGLAELPADYYLFGFSNAELWELLSQPAAWSSHDVRLARWLLRERGETVSEATIQDLQARHLQALAAPSPSPTAWIAAGYVLALLGGLFGLGIGWSLWHYQKTLPDGRQVPGYSARDRAHGVRIIVLGVICLGLWLGLRLVGG